MYNPKRVNRNKASNIIIENPELFEHLVTLTFKIEDKLSIKAAWVLEWICTHYKLDLLLPFLDTFTQNIKYVHFDSSLRPCAKICELLAINYTSKKHNLVKETLTTKQIDQIIETGFDWLITPQKIAVKKAYTMNTLYLFGLQKDWVHPELDEIIRKDVIHQSKGCEARGKKIITLIKERL